MIFLHKRLRVSILFFLLTFTLLVSLHAQEVHVVFNNGIINIPHGLSEVSLSAVQISDASIKNIMLKNNVQSVMKMFPEFELADTLRVNRTGELVRLTNLSNFYILKVMTDSDVNSLVKLFKSTPGVVCAHRPLVLPENSILTIIEGSSGFLEPEDRYKSSDFIGWMGEKRAIGQYTSNLHRIIPLLIFFRPRL